MTVVLYVEGGGDSKELHIRCREAFRKLLEKAGFARRMPRIVACGGRDDAYRSFVTAHAGGSVLAILLVDSEDPVETPAWEHLHTRDHWTRPAGAAADQAQMMITSMETWLMADRDALRSVFGNCLHENALLPIERIEERVRQDVLARLEQATRPCGAGKSYSKGKRSFQILAEVQPKHLRVLKSFRDLERAVDQRL